MTEVRPIEVELLRIHLPLRRAHWAAHGREAIRDLILVRVVLDDGTEGWGECSTLAHPTYTGEYTAGAWRVLRDLVVPGALSGRVPRVVGHPMALAGFATAVLDAELRRRDRSLAEELASLRGHDPRPAVRACAVVSRADGIGDLVAAVAERVAGRVALVKLKVSPAEEDLAAVGAVRQAWPDLALAVDFNGTADLAALRRIDNLGLVYIEQPAPADALVTSAHMASCIETPVALDESVWSAGTLDAAVALRAGSILNVKPARCGGPHAAAALVHRALEAGLEVFVGGMVESGVGRAAALAVAALPQCTLPTDLGPSLAYVERDITEPLRADVSGQMVVPTGPGIGRTPLPSELETVVVDRHEFTA